MSTNKRFETFKELLLEKARKLDETMTTEQEKDLFSVLKEVHKEFEYFLNKLPDDLRVESDKLINRCWFVCFHDDHTDDFAKKREAIIGQSRQSQDKYLSEYYAQNIDLLKDVLIEENPSRTTQIKDAFEAHHCGLYYASIPTLLALSDGVCRDIFKGTDLYSKYYWTVPQKGNLPKTDDLFDSVSGLHVFEEIMFAPLRKPSSLTKSIHHPSEKDKTRLNRHLIMHGNSNKYGTKINSLKAISLLYYVNQSLRYLSEEQITS